MKDDTKFIIVIFIALLGFAYGFYQGNSEDQTKTQLSEAAELKKYDEISKRLDKLELDFYMQKRALKRIEEKLEGK